MRKKLSESLESEVLSKSRRRCCICYGLNRHAEIVQGQIAHLDKDPNNNKVDNLAFLCFDHHDQFDSKTSQSKGLKAKEVLEYRDELYAAIGDKFSQEVHFGVLLTDPNDPYAGKYTRIGSGTDSAELVFTPVPDSLEGIPRYFVTGLALSGSWKPGGPNMGDFGGVVEYEEPYIGFYSSNNHEITFRHDQSILLVSENFEASLYGMGVTFEGTYRRA